MRYTRLYKCQLHGRVKFCSFLFAQQPLHTLHKGDELHLVYLIAVEEEGEGICCCFCVFVAYYLLLLLLLLRAHIF